MCQVSRFLFCAIITVNSCLAEERKLPSIELTSPSKRVPYSTMADLAIQGRLAPPLPLNVDIQIFHVGKNGTVRQQARVSGIRTDDKGRIGLGIAAPPDGWLPGESTVLVTLSRLRQVAAQQSITIAPRAAGVVPALGYSPLPESSGIVVDAVQHGNTPRIVRPGKYFLVRGEFGADQKGAVNPLGPSVVGSILIGNVIFQSGACVSLWDPLTKKYWYELQLLAPDERCEAVLELRLPSADRRRNPKKLPIPLLITMDEPLATTR